MKIELHGSSFESFEIPRFANGLIEDNSDEPSQWGKYPVKKIDQITVLSSDHLYVGVSLRDDDEHLAANRLTLVKAERDKQPDPQPPNKPAPAPEPTPDDINPGGNPGSGGH